MDNKDIYINLKKYNGIYGYMYGERNYYNSIEEDIIFIPQKDLQISKQADCFIYIWGWPGPDANFYKFKDYKKTWSFNKEDLLE